MTFHDYTGKHDDYVALMDMGQKGRDYVSRIFTEMARERYREAKRQSTNVKYL